MMSSLFSTLKRFWAILPRRSESRGILRLIARIRRYNRIAQIIQCARRPLYLQNIYTGEWFMPDSLRRFRRFYLRNRGTGEF
jgi:hypothetical protein